MLPIQSINSFGTLQETLKYFKENPDDLPLAAGTDIVPALRDKKINNVRLLDIHHLEALKHIYLDDQGVLHIGAMVTHEEAAGHPLILKYIPALAMACSVVGSPQIRARATIGGNICHASPAADTAPILAAAGACAVIVSEQMQRVVLLEQFWKEPGKTDLRPGELLKEVMIIVPENGWQGKYYKIGGRSALTIAVASAALMYDGNTWNASVGSMSAVIHRLTLIEQYLNLPGEPEVKKLELLLAASVSPITDIRATAKYRLKSAAGLLWQAWYEISHQM